jgi:multidrug efflux pump subunit AcrB
MPPGGEQTMSGPLQSVSAGRPRALDHAVFDYSGDDCRYLRLFWPGRAEDPPFTVKQMTVITVWPGATAQEMQDQVAEPLEKRLQELKWYDRTDTRPAWRLSRLSLQDSTPPSEVQEEFYQARKKLGDEAKNLPAGVIGPMINDEFPMSPLPSLR